CSRTAAFPVDPRQNRLLPGQLPHRPVHFRVGRGVRQRDLPLRPPVVRQKHHRHPVTLHARRPPRDELHRVCTSVDLQPVHQPVRLPRRSAPDLAHCSSSCPLVHHCSPGASHSLCQHTPHTRATATARRAA